MPFNFAKAWSIAQAVFTVADASQRAFRPDTHDSATAETGLTVPPGAGGLTAHLEARLTGVVVSALKEAFDRDAARTELERAALEDQRRRAEEALRLELVRQAGDHALSRLRTVGAAALLVWVVSVVFAMRFPEGLAGLPRVMLGLGWASLLAATGTAFTAHHQVSRWVARAQGSRVSADELPEGGAAAAAPWLALAGLALVAASLLLALG